MVPSNIAISHEQAEQIAKAILGDIESYIEQHRSEYGDFLKSEGYPESEVKHDDLK